MKPYQATAAACVGACLHVTFACDIEIFVPFVRYPRLAKATPAQRENLQLICDGEGIHWPDLDEDLSVRAIVENTR